MRSPEVPSERDLKVDLTLLPKTRRAVLNFIVDGIQIHQLGYDILLRRLLGL